MQIDHHLTKLWKKKGAFYETPCNSYAIVKYRELCCCLHTGVKQLASHHSLVASATWLPLLLHSWSEYCTFMHSTVVSQWNSHERDINKLGLLEAMITVIVFVVKWNNTFSAFVRCSCIAKLCNVALILAYLILLFARIWRKWDWTYVYQLLRFFAMV